MTDARVALAGIAVAVIAVAVLAGPATPAGAQARAPIEQGVVYESPKDADQIVNLYALDVADDGAARAVVEATAECDGYVANGTTVTEVSPTGSFTATIDLLGEEPEDLIITGSTTITGQLQADGSVSGTLDVDEAIDEPDFEPCEETDQPWAATPRPEPGLTLIDAYVPFPKQVGRSTFELTAGDDALFTTAGDKERRLLRIDTATGEVAWKKKVPAKDLPYLAFGQGLVWVSGAEGDDGPEIRSYDPSDGSLVSKVPGTVIAFAPDGTGWTVRDKGETLRRVDADSHEVTDEYDMDAKLAPRITASDDAAYVQRKGREFDTTLARVDATTGEITVEDATQIGDFDARVDAEGVWTADLGGVRLLDASTLEPIVARSDRDIIPAGMVTASPGVWLDDGDVTVLDPNLQDVVVVPDLFGPLATDGALVWVSAMDVGFVGLRTG